MLKLFVAVLLLLLIVVPLNEASQGSLAVRSEKRDDFKCELCEFIVGWIEGELANGTTEHRIAEEVGFLCNILPWPLGDACIWVVQKFVSIIINLLEDLLPPQRICYIVDMCNSLRSMFPTIRVTEMPCAKCMFYTAFAKEAAGAATNAVEVQSSVQKACDKFTRPGARAECHSYIAQPGVVSHLLLKTAADKLCSQLQSCAVVA